MKNKIVELPISEPILTAYNYQGFDGAVIYNNPSIRNRYINDLIMIQCSTKFLSGYTTPKLNVTNSSFMFNPYLEIKEMHMSFFNGYTNRIIHQIIDRGYYVVCWGIDDFYIEGKSWFQEKHFIHDLMIYGYDDENKTFSMLAYDKNWKFAPFKAPQKSFEKGRRSAFKQNKFGYIWAVKPLQKTVEIDPVKIHDSIARYLYHVFDDQNPAEKEWIWGIDTHIYLCMYLDKLMDGSIPYERMDSRIFRLIWEYEKLMLERIKTLEDMFDFSGMFSEDYKKIVKYADDIRMLYASYHMRRRDSILPKIKKNLENLYKEERVTLKAFNYKLGDKLGL